MSNKTKIIIAVVVLVGIAVAAYLLFRNKKDSKEVTTTQSSTTEKTEGLSALAGGMSGLDIGGIIKAFTVAG